MKSKGCGAVHPQEVQSSILTGSRAALSLLSPVPFTPMDHFCNQSGKEKLGLSESRENFKLDWC